MAYKHTLKRTPKSKSKSRSKPGPRGMIMAKDGLVSHDKLPRTLQKRYDHNSLLPIFRAPLEIRERIYKEVLGDYLILVSQNLRERTRHPLGIRFQRFKLAPGSSKEVNISYRYLEKPTLLAHICRHFHIDTSLLGFKMNYFSFYTEATMRWWLKTTKPVHMENLRQLCLPANYSWPVKDVEVFKGVQKFYYDNAGGEMKCLTAEEFKEDE